MAGRNGNNEEGIRDITARGQRSFLCRITDDAAELVFSRHSSALATTLCSFFVIEQRERERDRERPRYAAIAYEEE
jgi:hypothetical protein